MRQMKSTTEGFPTKKVLVKNSQFFSKDCEFKKKKSRWTKVVLWAIKTVLLDNDIFFVCVGGRG